jgi:hypothetical protein
MKMGKERWRLGYIFDELFRGAFNDDAHAARVRVTVES